MDNEQLLRRTRAFYDQLGGVGFTRGTYEDLGRAINDKTRFDILPMLVKRSLLLLVRDYHEQLDLILEAESVTEEAVTNVDEGEQADTDATEAPSETVAATSPVAPVIAVPPAPFEIAVSNPADVGAAPAEEMAPKGNEP